MPMKEKKRYGLPAARIEGASPVPIIAVLIPWDQFQAVGGPDAYASLIAKADAIAVIVSRSPDGKWASATSIERVWSKICEATPIESLQWHMMTVESDLYPWEMFGGAAPQK
jgi:hypothetical protein